MQNTDLIRAIGALTKIVQPKENKISFTTQNNAQALLTELVKELARRAPYIVKDVEDWNK